MMMVKKPKPHRTPYQTHDEPDEDFEDDEPATKAAVQPELEANTAMVVMASSHTHDGGTGHPQMVLQASQVPQTHTQATLSNPTSPMTEVIRKFLWTAQSG